MNIIYPLRILKEVFGSKDEKELLARDCYQKAPGGRFVFIHINKTGGISLGKALNLPGKMHYTAQEVLEAIGRRKWEKAYTFSIVRNPWDKVVSHYKYRVKTNQTEMAKQPIDFKDWVYRTYGKNKDPYYYDQPKMFQAQMDWLTDKSGRICVEDIYKFEHLQDAFEKIKMKLRLSSSLPHLNRTDDRHYSQFYDEKTKLIIAEWFKEDIELFGYDY